MYDHLYTLFKRENKPFCVHCGYYEHSVINNGWLCTSEKGELYTYNTTAYVDPEYLLVRKHIEPKKFEFQKKEPKPHYGMIRTIPSSIIPSIDCYMQYRHEQKKEENKSRFYDPEPQRLHWRAVVLGYALNHAYVHNISMAHRLAPHYMPQEAGLDWNDGAY